MLVRSGLLFACCLVAVPAAQAGPVLDRVRATHTIRCGASERPGLFEQAEDGHVSGALVDLCRAVGVAAAGPGVIVAARIYESDDSFGAIRRGDDDLAFLSGAETVEAGLAGAALLGPPVFFETSAIMVPGDAPTRTLADLAGLPICFMQGDPAHHHLEAAMAARHLPFVRMGYQEPIEMDDAFEAGRCKAAAGAATTLADSRRDGGPVRRGARLLAEPLVTVPIFAATGTGDGQWSAAVGWTVATLEAADRPAGDWAAGGLAGLPVDATALGLAPGWQKTVLDATGSYAALLRRNAGDGSTLHLPPGPNALVESGGLLLPPVAE